MTKKDQALLDIAKSILDLETLQPRNMDSLDFKEQGVVSIKRALEAAYAMGMAAGVAGAIRAQNAKKNK